MNLIETQYYGKIVKTPDDGYDVNDTSIDQANKVMSVAKLSTQQQESNKTYTSAELFRVYYEGVDWWAYATIPSFAHIYHNHVGL